LGATLREHRLNVSDRVLQNIGSRTAKPFFVCSYKREHRMRRSTVHGSLPAIAATEGLLAPHNQD
jgi:hypothetical protein